MKNEKQRKEQQINSRSRRRHVVGTMRGNILFVCTFVIIIIIRRTNMHMYEQVCLWLAGLLAVRVSFDVVISYRNKKLQIVCVCAISSPCDYPTKNKI